MDGVSGEVKSRWGIRYAGFIGSVGAMLLTASWAVAFFPPVIQPPGPPVLPPPSTQPPVVVPPIDPPPVVVPPRQVPEPATLISALTGAALVAGYRRLRQRRT
jgi:hypothetical protein